MIKKAYAKLRSKGVRGLLHAAYSRPTPQRLEYYPYCKPHFESKVGLEIGGPSGIFRQQGHIPVYPVASRVDNCNFGSQTVWEGGISEGATFIFDKKKAPGTQYITEASNLQCVDDSTYEFVLSSHCIEHLANPLKGLAEWIRVLKQDGIIVLIVPHKDGTFDHRRPVTSLEHLVQDFESQTAEDDMTHLEEILRLHDLSRDSGAGDFTSFQERSNRNVENRCLHQHVFDTRSAVEVVNYMNLKILAVELFHPYHIMIIAKKVSQNQAVNNEQFRGLEEAPCWSSPFPSDQLNHHEIA